MRLTVMTYNIQHGHVHLSDPGRIDLTETAEVIRQSGADLIGLNEVRGRGDHPDYTAQVEQMAAYLGFHCVFGRSIYVGGNNPYGNAVLSRFPIGESKVFHIPDPPAAEQGNRFEHRSILRAAAELPDGSIVTVYYQKYKPDDGCAEAESETKISVYGHISDIAEKQAPVFDDKDSILYTKWRIN